ELPKSMHLIKTAPRADVLVLGTCFSLTVLFDMVIAITVGILLSAVLFMNEIARLTTLTNISQSENVTRFNIRPQCYVYKVQGPLFFAAADKIFSELALKSIGAKAVILDLDGVPLL